MHSKGAIVCINDFLINFSSVVLGSKYVLLVAFCLQFSALAFVVLATSARPAGQTKNTQEARF